MIRNRPESFLDNPHREDWAQLRQGAGGAWSAESWPGIGLDDLLTGTPADDTLIGTAGDDTLDGAAGADAMLGGAGNDTYIVDNLGDLVTELANEGLDTVQASISYTLTAGVENLTLTGTANLNGTGNNLANLITGNSGNNRLSGGAGADTLVGGLGNDTYVVDNAGDIATEASGAGTDSVSASVSHTLAANVENLTLTGTGNLNGTGNALRNTLTGNAANNTLNGGTNADTLRGGAGNDTYVVDNALDVVTELAGQGTDTVRASISWTLGAELENLTLSGTGNLNATGNALANTLTGNSGANTLDGGLGVDTLVGGLGNDTYVIDNALDVAVESVDQGTDTVLSNISWVLGAELENLTLFGSGNNSAIGNSQDNLLTGNSGDNTLDGSTGFDTVLGGSGNDLLTTSDGDEMSGGEGDDTLLGGASNDVRLHGGVGNDSLNGGAGSDALYGEAGDDTLVAGGNDSGFDTLYGGSGNDSLVSADIGGSSIDQLYGEDGDDTLIGSAGFDSMFGGAGDDSIDAGAGDDFLFSEEGDDILLGGSGNDYLTDTASDGNDTLAGGADLDGLQADWSASTASIVWNNDASQTQVVNGNTISGIEQMSEVRSGTGNDTITNLLVGLNDLIYGGGGNDSLNGGAGSDALYGEAGDDTLVAGGNDSGFDRLYGGAGNDRLVAGDITSGFYDQLYGEDGDDTLIGSAGTDYYLYGAAGDDSIDAGAGDDALYGDAGNDTLDGAAGADTLVGGAGDDTYVIDNAGDAVTEGADGGTDTVLASISYTMTAEVENLTLASAVGLAGIGNALANVITGNTGNDTLDGAAGADTLVGGLGNDTYVVDNALDVVTEGAGGGTDTVLSVISYTLSAEVENLTLNGTAGLAGTGNALANVVTGNTGNDTLDGAAGADTLVGGLGNDTYVVDNALDVVTEGAGGGTDTVLSAISYTLSAEAENLTLTATVGIAGTGNALANVITGNTGNDTLDGAAGADTLVGGLGSDTLTGGAGADIFSFNSLIGSDTVVDFTKGSDKLSFSQGSLPVGDRDTSVERAVTITGPGGFGTASEVVVVTANIAGAFTAAKAASVIGSANRPYGINESALFVVDNGSDSAVYYFKSLDGDAVVSADELTLLVTVQGVANLAPSDVLFGP